MQCVKIVGLNADVMVGTAALATRALSGMLYGTQPIDPVTFISVPALLLVVAVAAAWWPARRAAGVDPVTALRTE